MADGSFLAGLIRVELSFVETKTEVPSDLQFGSPGPQRSARGKWAARLHGDDVQDWFGKRLLVICVLRRR